MGNLTVYADRRSEVKTFLGGTMARHLLITDQKVTENPKWADTNKNHA